MRLLDRLKGVAIALLLLMVAIPVAVVTALLTVPLLRWLESRCGIEAIGHSGPAEWVYLTLYLLIVTLFTALWSHTNRKRR